MTLLRLGVLALALFATGCARSDFDWAQGEDFLLEKKKLPQLMQYAQELNNLPRDLALDERALQMCFGRAFSMADPKDARRLDPRKTKELADEWFEFMSQQNLEIPEVETIPAQHRYPPQRRPAAGLSQPGTTVQPGLQVPRN